jgi:transcriptional regulator with XRE-family HTH domain
VEQWSLEQEFGALLRTFRTRAGMSQEDLASASALSRTSIVNIENGRQGVSIQTLYRLADALECEPAELLPGRQRPEIPAIALGDGGSASTQAVLRLLQRVTNEREARRDG